MACREKNAHPISHLVNLVHVSASLSRERFVQRSLPRRTDSVDLFHSGNEVEYGGECSDSARVPTETDLTESYVVVVSCNMACCYSCEGCLSVIGQSC